MSDLVTFGWETIVGHERVLGALRRATLAERPHSAYLLLGPAGLGKTLIAHTLAAGLVCESAPHLRPCRECGACRKVAASTHTDVWTELPTGRSKTITVDQIADIQRRLSFRRLEGRHRVVLILGAGTMNEHAQNKLLKTLEEPPEGTVIILTALHPGLMLQTVRSRCQKLRLGGVSADVLRDWLVGRGADPEGARIAAASAGGLPGRALEFMEPEVAAARAARVQAVAAALGGGDPARDLIKEFDRDRAGAQAVVSLMQELLRDAATARLGSDDRIHPDAQLPDALASMSGAELARLVLRGEEVQDRLIRNVHPGGVVGDYLRDVEAAT